MVVLDNFLMGPQIIASADAPSEITKPEKLGIEVCSYRSRSFFWDFECNKRSNNLEKNSNRSYRSLPQ